jgi:phospholipid/cholesterol/gamma-HCH transport system substrate-binding protein
MGRLAASIGGFIRRAGVGVIAAVVVVALIVVGVIVVTSGSSSTHHITAYFKRTVGLYTGNDVRILGVKVGHIDSITPAGSRVKVEMSYDGDDKVPADARAVIITPSIVSDRYVQLTPAWTTGPTMPDKAVLGCIPSRPSTPTCEAQTAIPLELDEIFGNLDTLNVAVGPKGANNHGALSNLIKVSAANLKGNGGHFNRALKAFSQAVSTLSGSRGDLFSTIAHLQRFTTTLAQNDGGIRTLNANLAQVGGQLAGERRNLGAALANLATALSAVNQFVSANRQKLTGDIHGLTKVTNVLTKEQESITQFTDLAPFALSNLSLTYDPQAMTLDTKSDTAEPLTKGGPSGAVCQLLHTLQLDDLIGLVSGCGGPTSNTAAIPSTRHPRSLSDLLGVHQ